MPELLTQLLLGATSWMILNPHHDRHPLQQAQGALGDRSVVVYLLLWALLSICS